MATSNLRERKKERTRATITRVALDLFARDGFAATTLPAIAEAAEVSPRTVSTYFPSKEGIVFDVYQAAIDRFALRLEERSPDEKTFDVLRAWLRDEESIQLGADAGLVHPGAEDEGDFPRLREAAIASDEDLWGLQRRYMRPMKRHVARGIAQDLDKQPDSLPAQLIAESVVSALLAVNAYAARDHAAATDAFETALAFLREGLSAFET
ncbi:TetR/AcrR family transcriptional regulator [Solirubrobacter phytolaccae]|uniref:TetR/AcrR family transcriptional regulator n=1 Tax=Solirubrobacter phytolaccae TaxID=1404360 RepID=A0A9X3N9K9_9ACTN|nr:TetR/AcrR family transcriptional regulator [Solirubrobacter phytolaccae]MDA0182338.1 TetR/AcrR family transcriptional regulator [Solirubrobacter phytolaccae]